MRRAALHDQIGTEIAERHGRHVGEGAPENVEHHHQRGRQRDAADRAARRASSDSRARWRDSANEPAGPWFTFFPEAGAQRRFEIGDAPRAVQVQRIVGGDREVDELDGLAVARLKLLLPSISSTIGM